MPIFVDIAPKEAGRVGMDTAQRWSHSFRQFSEIYKWNVRGGHAANLVAGSVAKHASSGV